MANPDNQSEPIFLSKIQQINGTWEHLCRTDEDGICAKLSHFNNTTIGLATVMKYLGRMMEYDRFC